MAETVEWIKAHYDRVTLIAAAALLFISAIFIWWNVIQFGNRLAAQHAPPPKTASPPAGAVALDRAAKELQHPAQWTSGGRSGLFVPERHFIGSNGMPATLETTQVHPPVPNEWLTKYNLPIEKADVLDEDPDGDGFTNLDEWQGGTDPANKDSHPDYLTKLHLVSVSEEPFPYIFSSHTGSRFGINSINQSEPTQFLKIGDVIRGTEYKIINFSEKHVRNQYGTSVDVSELLLKHQQTGVQITLVKEKVAPSPQSVASFVYTWGGRREFDVRKDQEFSLPPIEQIKYKLIDVQSDKAVIVNTQKPNEPIEIGFANP